jgi:tetratricopeptide (TPR) repeat protein
LLARLNELHILVTSHAPLNLVRYEQTIEVKELAVGRGRRVGAAEQMFIAYTPQKRQAEVLARHFNTVQAICRELEGYPLGIVLEAAQLSDEKETPEHLLENLRANMVEALRYAQAADLPPKHKSVGAALKGAYEKLGAAARRLLAHIAVFSGGAAEEMLDALEESGWREAEREVRKLRLASWAEGRYRMLAPIRAWAQTTLPADELSAYCLRAARWLNEQAGVWDNSLRASKERHAYAQQMAETTGQKVEDVERAMTLAALAAFDRERENLLVAVKWAYDAQAWEATWRLAGNLAGFFNIRSLWADWVETHGLALKAARQAGDRHGEARMLGNLGSVYLQQGRWDEAIEKYEASLRVLRDLGDRHGEGQTLGNLGSIYQLQGRWDEAIEKYEASLRIVRDLGDRHGEGATLNNLGEVYRLQGHWDEAIAQYEASLQIFRDLGDRYGEGTTLMNLGSVYLQQGRWDEAIEKYEASLHIKRDLGDRHGEAQTLGNLGNVYLQQGRWDEAIEKYEASLHIERELGDRYGEGATLNNLGLIYADQGRWDEAIEKYEASLRICRDLGDRHGEGVTLMNMGLLYERQGQKEKAVALWREALEKLHPDSPEYRTVKGWLAAD